MNQLGFHLTPNHLMQYIKEKAIKFVKTQGRVKCIWGLPSLTERLGSCDVPQVSDPTSTGGLTSSTTWLTTMCSHSFTTCSNNSMFNMMRDTKIWCSMMDAKLTTWIQLSFAVQLQVKLTKPFCNTYFNCQGSLPTNDPRSSLNPKFKQKPNSLKVTICFYELII